MTPPDPIVHDGSLFNRHPKGTQQPSEIGNTNGIEHFGQSTPELKFPTEAVSLPPSSPTATPPEGDMEPVRKVRFYNRVRITSGVGHAGRPKTHSLVKEDSQDALRDSNTTDHGSPIDIPPRRDAPRQSEDSSASASYSSSISAPLRSSTELPPRATSARSSGKKAEPLSDVLGSQGSSSWLHALAVERRERKKRRVAEALDETSPLLQVDGILRANSVGNDLGRAMRENGQKLDEDPTDDWPWKLFSPYVSTLVYSFRIHLVL